MTHIIISLDPVSVLHDVVVQIIGDMRMDREEDESTVRSRGWNESEMKMYK